MVRSLLVIYKSQEMTNPCCKVGLNPTPEVERGTASAWQQRFQGTVHLPLLAALLDSPSFTDLSPCENPLPLNLWQAFQRQLSQAA